MNEIIKRAEALIDVLCKDCKQPNRPSVCKSMSVCKEVQELRAEILKCTNVDFEYMADLKTLYMELI